MKTRGRHKLFISKYKTSIAKQQNAKKITQQNHIHSIKNIKNVKTFLNRFK